MFSSVLLVCEGLHSGFCINLSKYLLGHAEKKITQIFILYQPLPNERLPLELQTLLGENMQLFYGSPTNGDLLRKIINDNNIEFVFQYVDDQLHDNGNVNSSTIQIARKHLLGLTSLLEALRKCQINQFVQIYGISPQNAAADPEFKKDGVGQYAPIRPHTMKAARFASDVALLHAYAKSYRLNIRVAKVLTNGEFGDDCCDFVHKLALRSENEMTVEISTQGPSGIESKECAKSCEEGAIAARFLLYGSNNWVGEQFLELLKEKEVDFRRGTCEPGIETAEHIRQEILEHSPSHVLLFVHPVNDNQTTTDYAGAGPTNLLYNVRDNLYAPWQLANLCEKLGIHFTYVGTSCLYSHSISINAQMEENGMENLKIEEWNGENRFTVTKKFSDMSLASLKKTLNVRFQLPFNNRNEPQNFIAQVLGGKLTNSLIDPNRAYSITHLPSCLPILLKVVLNQEVGQMNLVQPQPVELNEIVEIIGGNERGVVQKGQDKSAEKQFVLDSTRICSHDVLSTETAVEEAIAGIRKT